MSLAVTPKHAATDAAKPKAHAEFDDSIPF
jgi:hypothetical protein